jgi:hypothetical protein
MPPEIWSVLTQIPIVGVFIWFVLEWSRRNQAGMDKRDEAMEKRDEAMRRFLDQQRAQDRSVMVELVQEIREIGKSLERHDRRAENGIRDIMDQTKPRSRKKKE